MSLFEIKNPLPFDSNVLANMYNTAKGLLHETAPQQYTEAIVLLTAGGKEYSSVIQNAISRSKADEKALLNRLHASSDTEVCYVLCMWHHGQVDIPSYDFRKMLYSLDSKNKETKIFVRAMDGYSVIKLGTTIK